MKMRDHLYIMNRTELLRAAAYLGASTRRETVRDVLYILRESTTFTSRSLSQIEALGKSAGLSGRESASVLTRPRTRPRSAIALFVMLFVLFLIVTGVIPYVLAGQGTPSTYAPGTRYASISPRDFK